jgi:hypothetical protein
MEEIERLVLIIMKLFYVPLQDLFENQHCSLRGLLDLIFNSRPGSSPGEFPNKLILSITRNNTNSGIFPKPMPSLPLSLCKSEITRSF